MESLVKTALRTLVRTLEDNKEDNKNPQVFYYCTVPQRDRKAFALIGVQSWSDVGDNYYYDKSKIANSEGKLLDNQNIYYRGMKAEGMNENHDSFWESLTIITSPNDQIIAEANYSQDASLTSEVATESDQETFLVIGASGKFEGAKKIVVEYDNDLTKSWTPELIRNHKSKFIKFRRVTVHH